jgi:hypothetical protein
LQPNHTTPAQLIVRCHEHCTCRVSEKSTNTGDFFRLSRRFSSLDTCRYWRPTHQVNHTTGSSGRSSTGLVKCGRTLVPYRFNRYTKKIAIRNDLKGLARDRCVHYYDQSEGIGSQLRSSTCTYRLTQMTVTICVVAIRRSTKWYILLIMPESY